MTQEIKSNTPKQGGIAELAKAQQYVEHSSPLNDGDDTSRHVVSNNRIMFADPETNSHYDGCNL